MRSIALAIVLLSTSFVDQFAQAQSESRNEPIAPVKPTAKKKKVKQKPIPAPVQEEAPSVKPAVEHHASSPVSSVRFIRQNGHPSGGVFEVTPLIGIYGLIGYDIGIMGAFRIIDDGFIPILNNSISVEAGIDSATWKLYSYTNRVVRVTADGRWDFHLTPFWTVYSAAGLALEHSWTTWSFDGSSGESEATNNIAIHVRGGGAMHFSDNFALRLDYDTASTARVGATFSF